VEERHGVTTKAVCWILAGALALATFSARAADPIRIGMIAPLTGPQAEGGRLGIQGAKLAVDEINQAGGILGRQLELVFEDDQSTNPGTVLAFSKLAGHAEIQALIGPSFSTKHRTRSSLESR
jgi:branched-chain amino acid transport system substrate-binding protein